MKKAGGGLERMDSISASVLAKMELDLDLHLGRQWFYFFSFIFLLLGCGFDDDLIMMGL